MLAGRGGGLRQLPSPQHLWESKGKRGRDNGQGFLTIVSPEVGMLLQSSSAHNVVFALSMSILSELIDQFKR